MTPPEKSPEDDAAQARIGVSSGARWTPLPASAAGVRLSPVGNHRAVSALVMQRSAITPSVADERVRPC